MKTKIYLKRFVASDLSEILLSPNLKKLPKNAEPSDLKSCLGSKSKTPAVTHSPSQIKGPVTTVSQYSSGEAIDTLQSFLFE